MFSRLLRSRAVSFGLAGILASAAAAQEPTPPVGDELRSRLDEFLSAVVDEHAVPGLAVAVVKGGEIAYAEAFGVRSLARPEPVTPESVFHLASVSKVFVATAIMQLVEQGQVSLTAPVVEYLPYFRLADETYRDITIEQLLSHTSGIPDVRDYGWDSPETDEEALERFVRSLADWELRAAPGEGFRYSNAAYEVLGDVVAKVSGASFEEYMGTHIFGPLEMRSTTFFTPEVEESLRTSPHDCRLTPEIREVYPYNRAHAPSSTLQSSVLDMTRWTLANLNHGELDGQRVLAGASYEELWGPRAEIRHDRHMGLSWILGDHRGITARAHGGRDPGFASAFILFPDRDFGVIVLSNWDRAPVVPIRKGVTDIVLGHEAKVPAVPLMARLARGWRTIWE